MHGLLSTLIWLPIAAGVLALILGDSKIGAVRWLALIASIATLILSLPLWSGFDTGTASMQFGEKLAWIPRFSAFYSLGVDGISMPLVVLTAFMTVPVIIAAWTVIETRPSQYFAAFLVILRRIGNERHIWQQHLVDLCAAHRLSELISATHTHGSDPVQPAFVTRKGGACVSAAKSSLFRAALQI